MHMSPSYRLNISNLINDMKYAQREWNNKLILNIMFRENKQWYFFVPFNNQSNKLNKLIQMTCCNTNQCKAKLAFSVNKESNYIVDCVRVNKHQCIADINLKPTDIFNDICLSKQRGSNNNNNGNKNIGISWKQFESSKSIVLNSQNILNFQEKIQIDVSSNPDSNIFDILFDQFSFEFVKRDENKSNGYRFLYQCSSKACDSKCEITTTTNKDGLKLVDNIKFVLKHSSKCYQSKQESSIIKKMVKPVSRDQTGEISWNQFICDH